MLQSSIFKQNRKQLQNKSITNVPLDQTRGIVHAVSSDHQEPEVSLANRVYLSDFVRFVVL